MSPATSRRPTVLAVYAHPDDELFHGGGMLARLSDRGVRVVLACATKGEAGKAHASVQPVTDLGALRAEELRLSCQILGIEPPVFLGFRDSARKERQRHDDPHALANVDMLEVEAAVRRVIADVKPHIVITFDPHGGYYHPDHLAVHRATTAAFHSSGILGAEAPERLATDILCVAPSLDVIAYLHEVLRQAGHGVMTSDNVPDALMLLRATHPKLIVVSADLRAAGNTHAIGVFRDVAKCPVIELPSDFSHRDAGVAASRLLEQIRDAM